MEITSVVFSPFLTPASTSLLNVSITYSSPPRRLISMPTLCQRWARQQGEGGLSCVCSSSSGGQGWRYPTAGGWSRCLVPPNMDTHRSVTQDVLHLTSSLSFLSNFSLNNVLPYPRLQSCCWSRVQILMSMTSRAALRWCWLPLRATWAPLNSCCQRVWTFPRYYLDMFTECTRTAKQYLYCLWSQVPLCPLLIRRGWLHLAGPVWRARNVPCSFWWRQAQTWINRTDRDGLLLT